MDQLPSEEYPHLRFLDLRKFAIRKLMVMCADSPTTSLMESVLIILPHYFNSSKAEKLQDLGWEGGGTELASDGAFVRRVVRSTPGGWLSGIIENLVENLAEIDDTPGKGLGQGLQRLLTGWLQWNVEPRWIQNFC